MRGRWLTGQYVGLRNAAWAVRNSRAGAAFNLIALRLVLPESGEPLAFAELLTIP